MEAEAQVAGDEAVPEAPEQFVVLISAGASHSVALLSGKLLCSWGRGEDGQLGHGDAEDRPVPTVLSAFDVPGIVSVICGADHTTAYSDDEMQLYSWGWGDFGRLGHGNSSDVFNPQPIEALQGLKIKQIACGDSHCLAVTVTGQVQSWGRNQNGQLGLGNTEDSLLPQKIQAFEVFAMEGYMHILRADNLDGSEEIWDDPFICPPVEQTCAVAQDSQPTGGNDEYSQHTKSSKKRTKNFTADEDEKLISAWLNVGLDPIESNNQSMSRYWQRMHAAFHEHKDFESDRSETSLMNRWSIINANVSRFCGVYAQVVRRKQSGLTEQDKIDHAKALYKNGHPKKQSFMMDHCWKKLCHEQKWIQRTDKSQNETTREQAPSGASPLNCSPGSNEQAPNEAMTRPPGKKQEKERQRRGKRPYGDGENHLKEVMSDFWIKKKETEDLRELRKKERNDERLQLERERLELQRKDVEMKQRIEDERIINIDISTMSPDQQQFYKRLKDEIFTRRFGEPPVRGDTASI